MPRPSSGVKAIVMILLASAMFLQSSGMVLASSTYWNYGAVSTFTYIEYYDVDRTTDISPYGIAFRKDSGEAVAMKWIHCGTMSGCTLQYMGPGGSPIWTYLRANNPSGTSLTFCMAMRGYVWSGSISGLLDWDE